MEHSLAVSILEAINKDSKVFQGVLVSHDCYPIINQRKNVAKLLASIANGLLDHPHQTDLFTDAPKDEVGSLVECSACHEKQPDGGPGQFCQTCGVGPMPTNFVLSAKSCLQAVNAVLADTEDELDIEVVESWSAAEMEEAIKWAKDAALCEGDDVPPRAPIHLLLETNTFELTDEEVHAAIARVGDPIPMEIMQGWSMWMRSEAVSWALETARKKAEAKDRPSHIDHAYAHMNREKDQAELDVETPPVDAPEPTKTPKAKTPATL